MGSLADSDNGLLVGPEDRGAVVFSDGGELQERQSAWESRDGCRKRTSTIIFSDKELLWTKARRQESSKGFLEGAGSAIFGAMNGTRRGKTRTRLHELRRVDEGEEFGKK